ncbi:MAG TPA: hypothetical protein DDZ80_32260 [Cyanobacteria bacterium UBA8803]|nr:hypothetical protein [Cyanobacteria bacterium UBA9273]HBL62877.1 hypothetical protein [Cyanobacteria bacterium UBA8803]
MNNFFQKQYSSLLKNTQSVIKSVALDSGFAWFSWLTLLFLSLFSWLMAFIATGLLQNLLANLGCIFLILAVYWWTTSTKSLRIYDVPLSPWITGAIVSVYIFGAITGKVEPKALIAWPLISAAIAALPLCLGDDFKLKTPAPDKRKTIILLFTSQLIFSCWFQFHFLVQNWLAEYPTLLVDNFDQSAFVVKYPLLPPKTPRGVSMLDLMASKLQQQLNAKPWPQIERVLLPQERDRLIQQITAQTKQQIASAKVEEDDLWQVGYTVSLKDPGYNLALNTSWQGPRSQVLEGNITKSCQINPVNRPTPTGTTVVSRVRCEPAKGWGVNQPLTTANNNPTRNWVWDIINQ